MHHLQLFDVPVLGPVAVLEVASPMTAPESFTLGRAPVNLQEFIAWLRDSHEYARLSEGNFKSGETNRRPKGLVGRSSRFWRYGERVARGSLSPFDFPASKEHLLKCFILDVMIHVSRAGGGSGRSWNRTRIDKFKDRVLRFRDALYHFVFKSPPR